MQYQLLHIYYTPSYVYERTNNSKCSDKKRRNIKNSIKEILGPLFSLLINKN